jgi:hypothetical protein
MLLTNSLQVEKGETPMKVHSFLQALAALVLAGTLATLISRPLGAQSGDGRVKRPIEEPDSRVRSVSIVSPLPVPISGSTTVSGTVGFNNFPNTLTGTTVPVALARTPVHDGQFFDITQPNSPPFQPALDLHVPAGVVLTGAHVTFSVPENVPNAASLFISSGGKILVYQIVNSTTFNAGIDLESGIVSTGDLTVELSCYNISGNHCQGAIMWSGYTIP